MKIDTEQPFFFKDEPQTSSKFNSLLSRKVSFVLGFVACLIVTQCLNRSPILLMAKITGIEAANSRNLEGRKLTGDIPSSSSSSLNSHQHRRAHVPILYPLKVFDLVTTSSNDWRSHGVYSSEFAHHSSNNPQKYRSLSLAQDKEDIWLYENWFFGYQNGVMIESGALNGEDYSTSYMFEKFASWSTVHIEADPQNFRALKDFRNESINIHAALCSESRKLHYASQTIPPVRGFVEFMSEPFLQHWHPSLYENRNLTSTLPTVQCIPMKYLLRELNLQQVDVWILDVEGAEESVLNGVDFTKVKFNAIVMECDGDDNQKNTRKIDILYKYDYDCSVIGRNCMCKHKSFRPSKASSLR